MKAIVISKLGKPEVLQLRDVAYPEVKDDEVQTLLSFPLVASKSGDHRGRLFSVLMFLDCVCDSCSVIKKCPHLLSYVHSLRCDSTAAHLTRIIAKIVELLTDSSDSGVRDVCRDMIAVLSAIYLKGKQDSVRESVTQALRLCVDGALEDSKISSGSEKTGEKRSDLADLMKNNSFHGSTLSPGSPTNAKGALPEKLGVEILNKKAPAVSDRLESGLSDLSESEGSAIQRHLLQLERQHNNSMNMIQELIGGSRDRMVTLERKVMGLERVFESMGRDLSILSGRRGNLTAGFGKYPSGKCNGQAPGDRDSHAASTNRQAGATSVTEASEDEATLGATTVAGKDGAVTRPTPIAAVPEAKAMGDEENKGQDRERMSTSFKKAILSFCAGDVDSAYAQVFGLGDKRLILCLMSRTGPCIRHMSSEIANKALNFIIEFLEYRNLYGICVSWIKQLTEVLLQHGSKTFEVPPELREDVLFMLLEASETMNQSDKLVMQLASAWDVILFKSFE